MIFRTTSEYDTKGHKIKEAEWNSRNEPEVIRTWEYNTSGNLVEYTIMRPDRKPIQEPGSKSKVPGQLVIKDPVAPAEAEPVSRNVKYDEAGRVIEIEIYENRELVNLLKYAYEYYD